MLAYTPHSTYTKYLALTHVVPADVFKHQYSHVGKKLVFSFCSVQYSLNYYNTWCCYTALGLLYHFTQFVLCFDIYVIVADLRSLSKVKCFDQH